MITSLFLTIPRKSSLTQPAPPMNNSKTTFTSSKISQESPIGLCGFLESSTRPISRCATHSRKDKYKSKRPPTPRYNNDGSISSSPKVTVYATTALLKSTISEPLWNSGSPASSKQAEMCFASSMYLSASYWWAKCRTTRFRSIYWRCTVSSRSLSPSFPMPSMKVSIRSTSIFWKIREKANGSTLL